MPHPPIRLTDIIGNQIEKSGRFPNKRAANTLKKILLKARDGGTAAAIIRYPLSALHLIVRYKLTIPEITEMFGKYATNWGAKQASFKFEGYDNDGNLLDSTEKAAAYKKVLYTKADSLELVEDESYDVTRIEVKALSQSGNVLPYSNEIIKVKVQGPVEVIGPKEFSLVGGQRAFWVRTIGESGKATITISSPTIDGDAHKIELDVKKIK